MAQRPGTRIAGRGYRTGAHANIKTMASAMTPRSIQTATGVLSRHLMRLNRRADPRDVDFTIVYISWREGRRLTNTPTPGATRPAYRGASAAGSTLAVTVAPTPDVSPFQSLS